MTSVTACSLSKLLNVFATSSGAGMASMFLFTTAVPGMKSLTTLAFEGDTDQVVRGHTKCCPCSESIS